MATTLRQALALGPVQVTFTKADGTRRDMRATTDERLFTYQPASDSSPRTEPAGVIRVWDLDNNGWRSIREDRVVSYGRGLPAGVSPPRA